MKKKASKKVTKKKAPPKAAKKKATKKKTSSKVTKKTATRESAKKSSKAISGRRISKTASKKGGITVVFPKGVPETLTCPECQETLPYNYGSCKCGAIVGTATCPHCREFGILNALGHWKARVKCVYCQKMYTINTDTVIRPFDLKKPPKPTPLPQNKHPFQHDYHTNGKDIFWGVRRRLAGVDRSTFEPLNNMWAKDSKGVYCQYVRMRTADVDTFEALNYIFAKDKTNVYYIMGIAKGLDAKTFRVVDDGMYANDKLIRTSAKQRAHRNYQHLGYGIDKNAVYFHNLMSGKPKAIRGADPKTFQRLEYAYAKDANSCYYRESKLKGSDPATFKVLSEMFAKDQNQVYCCWQPIPDADPKSFKILKPKQPSRIYFGRDKNHVFFHFEGIHPTQNPKKFSVIDGKQATDGKARWEGMDKGKGK